MSNNASWSKVAGRKAGSGAVNMVSRGPVAEPKKQNKPKKGEPPPTPKISAEEVERHILKTVAVEALGQFVLEKDRPSTRRLPVERVRLAG